MADANTAFVGSIPENYDRYLDFEVMGTALAARLAASFGDHPLRAPQQAIVITAGK